MIVFCYLFFFLYELFGFYSSIFEPPFILSRLVCQSSLYKVNHKVPSFIFSNNNDIFKYAQHLITHFYCIKSVLEIIFLQLFELKKCLQVCQSN